MALQSSGAISLDDMHQEAGGSANSNCTINDADIRALIDKSSGAEMAFDDFYGASASLAGDIMLIGYGAVNSGEDVGFITITSTGNTTDFGGLIGNIHLKCGAGSNSTRALIFGGNTNDPFVALKDQVQFLTIDTVGNGTDFGDLSEGIQNPRAVAYATRVLRGGGDGGSGEVNTIEFFTVASAGNATDHGDLTTTTSSHGGNINSTTRGIFYGGARGGTSKTNIIDFITMNSTGNATDFGDINTTVKVCCGYSSSTRGVINHGTDSGTFSNTMTFITIASTGNSQDFGDLSIGRRNAKASGNATRGVCAGGQASNNNKVTMDFITYASTGNSTDFGDIAQNTEETWAASNSHGGL